jgi:carboxypeptidase Taq
MSYAILAEHFRRLSHLRHLEAFASWDEATCMPKGGGPARGEALSTLRGLIHQHIVREDMAELMAAAKAEAGNLPPWQAANLREMEKEWKRAAALPQRLVEAISLAESRSEQAWRELRAANDFSGFLPFFREVVRLKREVAQALGQALSLDPYDALLDGFEPGARAAWIRPLFARLRAVLPDLLGRAMERQAREPALVAHGPLSPEKQRQLNLEVMRRIGFNFDHGRLDISHHPFCGGVPTDVRITTRYAPDDFTSSLLGVVHETGHAKYEQNLPAQWLDQPVGRARGMGFHEGQSLFWEMQVFRSRAFLEFLSPLLLTAFQDAPPSSHAALGPDNLLRCFTRVRPGLLRVGADEVSYPFHIILRFELEKSLFDGGLRPEEVPEAWDAGMQKLLGISAQGNHRDGCMQDVHWPAGLFGYFPGYTLGALTAAQLFRAIHRAHPDLPEQILQGEFRTINHWLRDKVWSQGSFLEGPALIELATGAPLATEAFEQHLERRYLRGES